MEPEINKVSEEVVSKVSTNVEEEITDSQRIDAIEDMIASQSKQISSIAQEQEKVADILTNIQERLSEKPKVENSEEPEVVNEISEAKPSETEVEENRRKTEEEIKKEAEQEVAEEAAEEEAEGTPMSDDEKQAEVEEEVAEEKSEEDEESEEEDEDDKKKHQNSLEPEESEETEETPVEESNSLEEAAEDSEESEVQEDNNIKENKMTQEEINALKEQIKNEILDAQVEAPEVEEVEETPAVETNWRKRYNDQVAAAWDAFRLNNISAAQKLQEINSYNASLKVENKAGTAPMTIESLGSFVLPPEVDKMIHGRRSNYSEFLKELDIVETDALTFAYATRVGDIDMQNVALCDDGKNGNLKPVEVFDLKQGVAQMEEIAAVTPICDNATKYLAADILSDVAAGYRNDYDRKLAQLAIIRMQQAVTETGNSVEFDPNDSVEALVDFIKATTAVSDGVTDGKFVFTAKTKAQLVEYIFRAAANGELGKDTMTTGEFQTIFGYPYVVVPNDLMPTLGDATSTKTFKATNNQTGQIEEVEITSPVFYGDLNEYRGKTSGALKYDVSAEASYEIGGVVRSAWQRNELVLRGSFLRGGYIADAGVFAGLTPKA